MIVYLRKLLSAGDDKGGLIGENVPRSMIAEWVLGGFSPLSIKLLAPTRGPSRLCGLSVVSHQHGSKL